MAAGDRRRVDRVVEVRVPDEHPGDAARRARVAVDQRLVRQRHAAQQQRAQRHARDVRVDEQRHALVGEPVARHAEPGRARARRQAERHRLELAQGLGVVAHVGRFAGDDARQRRDRQARLRGLGPQRRRRAAHLLLPGRRDRRVRPRPEPGRSTAAWRARAASAARSRRPGAGFGSRSRSCGRPATTGSWPSCGSAGRAAPAERRSTPAPPGWREWPRARSPTCASTGTAQRLWQPPPPEVGALRLCELGTNSSSRGDASSQ